MPELLIKKALYQGVESNLLLTEGGITSVSASYDFPIEQTIIADGLLAIPAFTDQHVHFRDPGYPQKENLLSGARAAAAGGYVNLSCEANTFPVIDNRAGVNAFYHKISEYAIPLNVTTKIALSKGQRGDELSDIPLDMLGKEISAVSSDGEPVINKDLLITALSLINGKVSIDLHCEETPASAALVRNILGEGIAGQRETDLIRFALQALQEAGCGWLHIQHVSLNASVKLINNARRSGMCVTSEVTPHHLLLSEEDIPMTAGEPDANWKMNPPLRSRHEMLAMRQALAAGEIDYIATDHAPHTQIEKSRRWDEAPYGVIGLENAFACCMALVHNGELSFTRLINAMSCNQQLDCMTTLSGLLLVDYDLRWRIDPDNFYSLSRNCPFADKEMRGKVIYNIMKKQGSWQLLYSNGEVLF